MPWDPNDENAAPAADEKCPYCKKVVSGPPALVVERDGLRHRAHVECAEKGAAPKK